MASAAIRLDYRVRILHELQARNSRESKPFQEIITFNNKLYESVDQVKLENVQLNIQKEKLQQENREMRVDGGSHLASSGTSALEKKVFQLQEEVSDLFRRKSEHVQQLIDTKCTMEEKEKQLVEANCKLRELQCELSNAMQERAKMDATIVEMQVAQQTLKDEHEALQLAFTSLQEKQRKLEREHNELITRWMALKTKAADQLNAENEVQLKVKQKQLQKELEDAAREQTVTIVEKPETLKYVPICIAASLPTRSVSKFDAHDGEVNAIKWSPSGNLVATGGGDRKVKLWEISQGQYTLKGTLTGNNAAVMSVDFDTEETVVLCASNDFASRVWTVLDNRLRHTLTGHSGKVSAAKFLGEPSKVASGSHDRTLKLWDLRSRACIRTIFAGSSCYDLVTSDSAGTNIISGHYDKRIRFWDTRSESSANEIVLQGKITSLDLSPDRHYLLSCVRDDTLKVLDLRMNQVVKTLWYSHNACHKNIFKFNTYISESFKVGCDWTRAKFSPDGGYVTAGSQDGSVFIWNAVSGKVEKILKEHTSVVTDVAWNSKGNRIVSCDRNKKVVLWADY